MKDTQAKPFHRIVVGIDGSTSSGSTSRWAANQAKLTGSSLEVLTTWEWPTSYGWVIPFPSDFDPKAETANDVSRVVKAAQDAAPGIALHTRIVEASHGADLLVVGSKGYGEFAGVEGRFK